MKRKRLFGALLLSAALAFGSSFTIHAGTIVGVPYTESGVKAGPGGAALPEIARSEEEGKMAALLQAAIDKTNTAESYHIIGVMNTTMSIEGVNLPVNTRMDTRYKGFQTDHAEFLSEMEMDMAGTKMPVQYFYTDGYLYMDGMGMKTKMQLPLEAAIKQAQSGAGFDAVNNTKGMKDLNVTAHDGVQTVYYTYDPAYLNTYVQEALKMAGQIAAQPSTDVRIDKCVGEASINGDGYLTNEKISMEMTIETEAEGKKFSMGMNMFMDSNYINPGQPVDFTLPSTDGYTEVEQAAAPVQNS